ncbi:MAG: hypothetical protein ABFR63_10100 [Thermodesulfobacteriota bacterium]
MSILFWVGSASGGTEVRSGCIQILETRCQQCHYLERVCNGVGEQSKRQWKATLKRMVKRRGATLEGNEEEELLACLSAPAAEVVRECQQQEFKK